MRRKFFSLKSFSHSLAAAAMFVLLGAFAPAGQAQTVDQLLANPAQVLAQFPNGGAQLAALIRDAAIEHPEALNSIIGLLSSASSDQQAAIGTGLGQAAQITVNTNPTYANQIQQAVAASGSQNASTSFAGVTGNVNIAATGPGGGGGGSGGPAGGPSGGPSGVGGGGLVGREFAGTTGGTFDFAGGGIVGTPITGGGGSTSGSNFVGTVSPR